MTTEKTNAYYDAEDLNRFAEMGQCALSHCTVFFFWSLFFQYISQYFHSL